MANHTTLDLALKSAEPILKDYIRELKTQNAQLQRQIVKLEAKKVSDKNRIAALQRQTKKLPQATSARELFQCLSSIEEG